MKLSKTEDSNIYTLFPPNRVFYKPVIATLFPPGILAIATAINAVLEYLNEEDFELEDFQITIDGFKEELEEVWDLELVAEEEDYDYSKTFDVRVTRNGNDYEANIDWQG